MVPFYIGRAEAIELIKDDVCITIPELKINSKSQIYGAVYINNNNRIVAFPCRILDNKIMIFDRLLIERDFSFNDTIDNYCFAILSWSNFRIKRTSDMIEDYYKNFSELDSEDEKLITLYTHVSSLI